jgi:hypothetical protein
MVVSGLILAGVLATASGAQESASAPIMTAQLPVVDQPVSLATPVVTEDGTSEAPHEPFALNGFYPMWESTGYVLGHRHAFLGASEVQFGIADVAQVGFRPVNLAMRTPNLQARFALYSHDDLHIAAQVAGFAVLPGAYKRFNSARYTSRLYNPDQTVWAVPASVAVSWRATSWLGVNGSMTALWTDGGAPFENRLALGSFVNAELAALAYHSVIFHAGEIGAWDHDLTVFGASYRFHYGWFEGRLGYFYRFNEDGMQSQPLLDVAIVF